MGFTQGSAPINPSQGSSEGAPPFDFYILFYLCLNHSGFSLGRGAHKVNQCGCWR